MQYSFYFKEKAEAFGKLSEIKAQPAGIIFFCDDTLFIDLFNDEDKEKLNKYDKVDVSNMASMRLHNCLTQASLKTLESIKNLPVKTIAGIRNFGGASLYELYLLVRLLANDFDGDNLTYDLEHFLTLSGNNANVNHCRKLYEDYRQRLDEIKQSNVEFPFQSLGWYLFELEDDLISSVDLTDELGDERKVLKQFYTGGESHLQNLNEVVGCFKEVIESLSVKEELKLVLYSRFGLDGSEKALEETGKLFNVSRERIRQLEKKAVSKISGNNNKFVIYYNLIGIKRLLQQAGAGGFFLYLFQKDRKNLLRLIIATVYRNDYRAVTEIIKNYYVNSGLQKKTAQKVKIEEVQSSDKNLYELLRLCRLEKAREEGVPAFQIMTNRTLAEVANIKPVNYEEWLKVKGLGEKTYNKLGEDFIEIIKNYLSGCGCEIAEPQNEPKEKKINTVEVRGYNFICDDSGEIITDVILFEKLRKLRYGLAVEVDLPAYCVVSNAALVGLATYKPVNYDEWLGVKGLGKLTYEKYGSQFIEEIISHNNGEAAN